VAVAVTETPDGATEEIRSPNVVLATNGFGANPEYVRRHIPEISEGQYHGGDGSLGDALDVGAALGADVGYLDSYQGHGSLATPHNILVTWAVVMHGGFLVNTRGERFGDETVGYSEYAVPVLEQPDGVAWVVFDERIDDLCRPFKDYQDLLEAKAVRRAADAGELAARIGCDHERLEVTLGETREAFQGGPDRFGRTDWEATLEPPYAAVKVTGALFHTQGGLKVDGQARVLRNGVPMPGLFAAGGAAVGISGHGAAGYLAGNGLLSALGLGYLAGRTIAG
jgi:fumarate reductase flavoprotein subunit